MPEQTTDRKNGERSASVSEVIEVPIADVFTFYAVNHHLNHPRWDPDIDMELETDGPIGVGSVIQRRTTRYEEPVEGVMEVTEFEPNESFEGHISEGGFEMDGGASFEEIAPGRTRLTVRTTVPDTIDVGMIRSKMERSVRTIKDLVENEYAV